MKDLAPFRAEIDRLDDAIVDLLTQRFAVGRKVAAFKKERGIAVRLPGRIAEVRQRCAERAAANGIDADFVARLYDQIIERTCLMEEELLDEK